MGVSLINFDSKATCEYFAQVMATEGRREIGQALRALNGSKVDHVKVGNALEVAADKIANASRFMRIDRNENGTAKMENGQPVLVAESKVAKS